jgi:ferritin-like metal-binding protein YciE
VEKTLVGMLGDIAQEINDPTVGSLFEEHQQVTKQRDENLEARIRTLARRPLLSKGIFNQVLGKLGDAFRSIHDESDKTTEDVMKAYATESFRAGMYQATEAYASAIDDQGTVRLARRHFE